MPIAFRSTNQSLPKGPEPTLAFAFVLRKMQEHQTGKCKSNMMIFIGCLWSSSWLLEFCCRCFVRKVGFGLSTGPKNEGSAGSARQTPPGLLLA